MVQCPLQTVKGTTCERKEIHSLKTTPFCITKKLELGVTDKLHNSCKVVSKIPADAEGTETLDAAQTLAVSEVRSPFIKSRGWITSTVWVQRIGETTYYFIFLIGTIDFEIICARALAFPLITGYANTHTHTTKPLFIPLSNFPFPHGASS